MADIKIFPNNYEAEQSLLGCILLDGYVAREIIPIVPEDFFYNERHRQLYVACLNLYKSAKNIDIVTVNDQLSQLNKTELDTYDYLVALTSGVPSAHNFGDYIDILKRDYTRRKIITGCNRIIEEAYNNTNTDEIIRMSEKEVYSFNTDIKRNNLKHIREPLNSYMAELEDLYKNKNKKKGLLTYYPRFDRLTNGLQKSDFIILAARPSVGKTSFVLDIVHNIIQLSPEKKVMAVFSLEMSDMQLVSRLLANAHPISLGKLSSADLDASTMADLYDTSIKLGESQVFIEDTPMISPAEVLSQCRWIYGQTKQLDLIVIDYLQLMKPPTVSKSGNTNKEMTDISRMLKLIAKEMNCPVVALSQMSRSIEQRDDKQPKLSDLRESGAIEQDADIVMFLAREDETLEKGAESQNIILEVAKHRNGELASIRLTFEGKYTRFTESENQSKPNYVFAAKKPTRGGNQS